MSFIFLNSHDLNKLADNVDEVLQADDYEKTKLIFDSLLDIEFTFESMIVEVHYLYILGNLAQNIYNFRRLDWFSDELSQSVIFFRKALFLIKKIEIIDDDLKYLKSLIETNLGNTLCSQGRAFCCIPFWDTAINNKTNAVPIISKATHLLYIANNIYYEDHKSYYYFTAYNLIQLGLRNIDLLYPEHKVAYSENSNLMLFKKYFETQYREEDFEYFESFREKIETRKQGDYLKWCGDNCLFINELNDINTSEYAYKDSIDLPPFVFEINKTLLMHEELMYHGNFDELKNDYCYARYLFFSAKDIPNEAKHFFNTTYAHVDDMSYAITNLKASHYKSAFRTLYSLFDKIAYFLNRFFDLNSMKSDSAINFDSIFRKLSDKKKWQPNVKLKAINNPFIHALFYILKDIRDVQDSTTNVSSWIDPDMEKFYIIRNAIEHRSLKIVDDFGYTLTKTGLSARDLEIDKLNKEPNNPEAVSKLYEQKKLSTHSLLIKVSDFESRLMSLMKLTRNSIMYLSLAIQTEEQKKKIGNEIIMSVPVPLKG